jgi:hypothetical protein
MTFKRTAPVAAVTFGQRARPRFLPAWLGNHEGVGDEEHLPPLPLAGAA